jgi:hypothetical protein
MPATFNHGLVKGRNASGPITKKRFVVRDEAVTDGETVKQAASATTAAEPLAGVSIFSVSSAEIAHGKGCSVVMTGRAVVTAAAALAVGARVTSDANGKAVAANTGDWLGGIVDEPASGADTDCSIVIVCDGTKA